MDDLIPLLIIILISVVGAYNRRKKKLANAQQSTTEEQTPKQDDLFSWMEKLTGEEEEKLPYAQTVTAPHIEETKEKAVVEEQHFEKHSNYNDFIASKTKHNDENHHHTKITHHIKTPHNASITEDDLTKQSITEGEIGNEKTSLDFDLKKAVIFSEILKPKYNY